MKQYCRYCAFCAYAGNYGYDFWCSDKNQGMSEKEIKRINTCKNFALCDLGDVISGKQYKPRKVKVKDDTYGEQMKLEL